MNRKMRRAAQSGARQPPTQPRHPPIDPEFLNAFLDRGWALLAAGRDDEAMEVAKSALHMQETADSLRFFVECAKRWTYFPGAENLRDVLARALREPLALPLDLIGITRGILNHDPVIGPAIAHASVAWPRRLSLQELLGTNGLSTIASDQLLLAMLESGKIVGIDFERFFTSLRAGLLEIAIGQSGRSDDGALQLACALARQCFINEYVFALMPDEERRVRELHDKITKALAANTAIAPLIIAMHGAYFGLDGLSAPTLLKRSWPKNVSAVLDQLIRAPAAERRHRKSIRQITPITDRTSVEVQEHYEQNPYPRWVKLPLQARSMPVDDWFRVFMPFSGYRASNVSAPEVLIAGCGTGHHSILFAQSYPGAKVLAVDLSMASLCYAKEKSQAMGLNNIEYVQGDILELGTLNRSFDIISSGGVLHHLEEPEKGWRTLLSLLRPDGCMQIGLYSEFARRHLVITRDWLAARGYGATPADIRRARQDIAAAHEPALTDILHWSDFYSISECRDLLFHQHERRFTIPQIQKFLDEVGFKFLGFSIRDDIRNQFRQRYSAEQESDLGLWHKFETEHPDTFRQMYEFWIQRRVH
ncbi:MAG TPA: class I SAM-dependent methyltransferase [Xanthobacteraceae bacterium]|nr:class I SAM-dependent methyltransferase [Xanthobacteraceae bacterium]